MTILEEIAEVFSIFHDGDIDEWVEDKNMLTLKVSCQYLAERIDPSYEYFTVELIGINHLELEPWWNQLDKKDKFTELADITNGCWEIQGGDVVNNTVLISLTQWDKDVEYTGGNMHLNCECIKVYDQAHNILHIKVLQDICRGYWEDWSKGISGSPMHIKPS